MITMKCYSSREEWLSNRKLRLGGSDAAAIIGLNPWKDNVALWKEKMGLQKPEDISDKDVVKYGNAVEPLLRRLFELDHPELKVYYREHNMWTNTEYPFAHASLDGWLMDQEGRKGIWECKTSMVSSRSQREKWNDKVPDNYYCQLLWYFGVTGFDFAILKAQLKSEFGGTLSIQTKEYRFERADLEDDINYIMQKGAEFAKSLETGNMPAMILPEII